MKKVLPPGLLYESLFVSSEDEEKLNEWLFTIHPIWEERYSANNPPPPGEEQRHLLRPVYWLGNWQFACLNYYHPPKWVKNCCVEAEPFPPVIRSIVDRIEKHIRSEIPESMIPSQWHLNTCLVNLYGSQVDEGKKIDTARVGEHKDFEPGPVASISLGERALFQFVTSSKVGERMGVAFEKWLDHRSLMVFSGPKWKDELFHRVQRVDRRDGFYFHLHVEGFKTRRINLTFRYIPKDIIISFADLPTAKQDDIRPYVVELAKNSDFFKKALLRNLK